MAETVIDRRCNDRTNHEFSGDTIKVKVGGEGIMFTVHAKVLRESSEFFDTALKAEWEEGRDGVVDLSSEDADDFARFVEWLYRRQIPCKSGFEGLPTLCKLYVLGETLLAAQFQNDIIDAFVCVQRHDYLVPKGRDIAHLYNGTPVGSPARKLMTDFYAHSARPYWALAQVKESHPEFLEDLVVAMIENRAMPDDKKYEHLLIGVPKAYYKDTSKEV